MKDAKRPDNSDLMHIEFHVSSPYPSQNPGRSIRDPNTKAKTEHVVLRLRPELPMKLCLIDGRGNLSDMDGALSHLPHLRTLTLETYQRTSHSYQLEEKFSVLPMDGRLRTRTYQDSYELALMAQKGIIEDGVAISTMWTDPASREQW